MYKDLEIEYYDEYPIRISAKLQQFTEDLIVNLGINYFPNEVDIDALDGICLSWYNDNIKISASVFYKEKFSIFIIAEKNASEDFDSFMLRNDFTNKLKIILYNYLGE